MEKSNAEKQLFSGFPSSSKAAWMEKATRDLKGENPLEKFAWQASDTITLEPYYTANDTSPQLDYLRTFDNRLYQSNSATGKYRQWSNLQPILVHDETTANKLALEALNMGADGICFELTGEGQSFSSLLKGIFLEHCHIAFQIEEAPAPFLKRYLEYSQAQQINPDQLHGHLRYELHPSMDLNEVLALGANFPNFHCLPIALSQHDGLEAPEKVLAHLLSLTVDVLDKLTDAGHAASRILRACFFSMELGADYFVEMCKLRAFRILLHQVSKAYGADILPEDFFLHALSKPWFVEDYQPHEDMLKGTSSAMAAILGGCHALTVIPRSQEGFEARISRNISNILKEEAYLDKMVDPMAGAYYLDHLTHVLVQAAWQLFLESEQQR